MPPRPSAVFSLAAGRPRLRKVKQFRKSWMPRRPSAVFSRAAGRARVRKVKQLRKSWMPRRPSAVFSRAVGKSRLRKVKEFLKSWMPRRRSAMFSRAAGRSRVPKVEQFRKSVVPRRPSAVFSRAAGMSLGVPGPRAGSLGVSQGPGRAAAGRDPKYHAPRRLFAGSTEDWRRFPPRSQTVTRLRLSGPAPPPPFCGEHRGLASSALRK